MADIVGMSQAEFYQFYTREEDYFPLVHPDDRKYYINNLNAILNPSHQRGLAHTFDYRIVRPDGKVRHVRELEYGTREKDGVAQKLPSKF